MRIQTLLRPVALATGFIAPAPTLHAGEADLKIPPLNTVTFDGLWGVSGLTLMYFAILICVVGAMFGMAQYHQTKFLPVHKSMADVSQTIWGTCKTYLFQQGKFLAVLWLLIGTCIFFYFKVLEQKSFGDVAVILIASVLGVLGSYGVAWFGIRINTTSNSRTAFAALRGAPVNVVSIPLRSGMSVGLLLVAVELFFMISILIFLPRELVGPCFIGFAIGESLGASVLRICGGIFTKIADIGSDLMKIVFKLPEDDPKNPGVIADCTGDNAGDSVGPTADGFETYGVTGVALIAFLALALAGNPIVCATLIIWLFVMRALMIVTSLVSYFLNEAITRAKYSGKRDFDFEEPLTHLVWITSAISIVVTFVASYLLLAQQGGIDSDLWWALSAIISCGTVAGAVIPELTKVFTSTNSQHVKEVTNCSKHGGASLNILSGFVAGNFSAFWMGFVVLGLMFCACLLATYAGSPIVSLMPRQFMFAAPIFAFGLVAFGFLGMGPVTIAVDSYGPVTDNAQSVYELSRIEATRTLPTEIQNSFGFKPDFENAKHLLEKNDGAGNTFKATAKPVLIGTAVVGATTMVFGIIMLLQGLYDAQMPSGGRRTVQTRHRSVERGAAGNHPRPAHGGRGDLLVHRREHAGRRHRRLSRGRLHPKPHETGCRNRVGEGQQGSCPHLHSLCAKRHVEHFYSHFLPGAGAGVFQSVFLHRLFGGHRLLWIIPSDFHGQRRRCLGQRQKNCRSGSAAERH